ncbi:hypothetical protein [Oscillatoria acuminata]|uniref:Uncharacterized protein n=1 Tax=Oscillatoria acuminata PCC 6304 TaxID=56110 RepID=K9TK53_9CYAN|nr:hypothetical protein [Oscillatoria acuminata]AFY82536.1 hypothetical protein Oscil6304_2935 [Oscillatoria acuminata PCC 6304]
MLEINAPNLYLFSYHLKEGLGISLESSQGNYRSVVEKIVGDLSRLIPDAIAEDYQETFLDLQTQPTADLKFKGTLHNHTILGRYLRRTLHQTYALIFDGSVQERYNAHQVQSLLSTLKALTPDPHSPNNLGQTWLISGVWEHGNSTQIEKLAEESYKTLISPEGWHHRATGDYVGVKLYEFWRTSGGNTGETIEGNSYLLLVLYPDHETFQAGWGFYEQWQQVFLSRHQIIWADWQSQHLKQQLIDKYQQIEAIADYSDLTLYHLKTTRDTLSGLITGFTTLEMYLNLMEIHLDHYDQYCHQLEQDADGLGSTDLTFLNQFSASVKQTYLPRLQGDINAFRLNWERIQHLTHMIQGLVEIRQAQRDRTVKTAVAIGGVGVVTGCIVAVASSTHPPVPSVNPGTNSAGLSGVLLLSVICGGVASLVTFVALSLWQKLGK